MASILVIDDEPLILENLGKFLRFQGHDVIKAHNGQEALIQIEEHLPDMIFCDVVMPRMDGLSLLVRLQSNEKTRSIPFVILSASAEIERLKSALSQGASAYVVKPFNLAEIGRLLELHLPPNRP
ncbi:MAG: PleD family two-component system response regulator [Acidovorax sp.]|jgi:CheY-like chemotaxis protein